MLLRWNWRWNILWILLTNFVDTICSAGIIQDFRLVTREDLRSNLEVFTQSGVSSYGQLMFDIPRYQLIVGSRNYLFRLSLEGLRKLEEAHWPSQAEAVETCLLKGKSQEECHNYIKVLVHHNERLFTCGTNAYMPECSWREISSLKTVIEWVDGVAKCPYIPDANSTALMTSSGDYYIASTLDFTGQDPAIYRIMGNGPFLRTVRFDPKWISEPDFVASYEIGNFTYFFFREAAVEYINCGKTIYSRVARICKNDQGGDHLLRENWTTFLKARMNCSIPGNYPFYFNEIQGIHFLEREQVLYATFTTPRNSIYGSAICIFNMSSFHKSFGGPFKYQKSPKFAWEKDYTTHKHFQCETPGEAQDLLGSQKYQFVDEAIQPATPHPLFKLELQRFNQIVVDVVQTKHHEGVHVMFVATMEGIILKLVVIPRVFETCLIEEIHVFPEGSSDKIKVLKLLRDTSSLYIGTEETVLRIPVHRCSRWKTQSECLNAMDPYCGWNEYQLACTTAPHRNPLSSFWAQEETACPRTDTPIDGSWSSWSTWSECSQTGHDAPGDRCLCQQRKCNNPQPSNGGSFCKGTAFRVTNCTRNGHWTDWSPWSACSNSCGLAVKTRRRSCSNPSPAHGGRVCIGPSKDEIYCTSNPPCPAATVSPVDGQWSEWSTWEECSAPCGGGIQLRHRRCNSPPPQNGGKDCIGCDKNFMQCNTHPCPEAKKSSSWTPWLQANRTKDGYFEQRFKFSCKANVPHENMLRIGHVKKEERFCLESSQNCLDAAFVNIDGEWSEWSSWSECSAKCGGGIQSRTRLCDSPRPAGSGSECQGLSHMERLCSIEPCKDSEGWEEWSVWSLCDKNQEQHRRRRCTLPMSGTEYCQGSSKETRMCIPGQPGILYSTEKDASGDDGIHVQHVVGSFFCGLFLGAIVSAAVMYVYMKRKLNGQHTKVATQLIPIKTNTYVPESEWQNNLNAGKDSSVKIPLREATIKRNGNFRAQIQADHNF